MGYHCVISFGVEKATELSYSCKNISIPVVYFVRFVILITIFAIVAVVYQVIYHDWNPLIFDDTLDNYM